MQRSTPVLPAALAALLLAVPGLSQLIPGGQFSPLTNPPPAHVGVTFVMPVGFQGSMKSPTTKLLVAAATFLAAASALPAGFTLTPDPADSRKALVSGVPEQTGAVYFSIAVSDAAGQHLSIMYLLSVYPPVTILPPELPGAAFRVPYSVPLAAVGGTGTYVWSLAGVSPPGLAMTGNRLTGLPETAGAYHFTVVARDVGPTGVSADTATRTVDLIVTAAPLRIQ
ncbi:MAG: hypothetical protein NTY38_30285, partial [Acidobacteria bacterium]|nr:hypothetical protein [Acidobacteriota bacterium]